MEKVDAINDIRAVFRKYLDSILGKGEVADDEDIFSKGYVNSLFYMQLMVFVEKTFGVVVGGDDLDPLNFRSIDSLTRFVHGKTDSVGRI